MINDSNFLTKLFINEAKPALDRHGDDDDGGSGVNIQELSVTENGTYTAPQGTAYSPVNVNVPIPEGGDASEVEKYFEGGYAEVNLPNVTKLKPYAFYNDVDVTNINMPKVTSIGKSAFEGCKNLTLTGLPSDLTEIKEKAFYSCSKLFSISLPSGVTRVENMAFGQCGNLTSVTLKGKPTILYGYAFMGCTNITDIYVPWAEGEVANAPWGATNATIHYNHTGG